jgi:hypothetical protein
VHCNYQAHFFTRPPLLESLVAEEEVSAWLARGSNRWNRGKDLSPVVLRAVADFILEREARQVSNTTGRPVTAVGDKSPSSLMDGQAVRLMHNIYPDGWLIYIVRDGRDTLISHRFQTFIEFPERLSKEDLKIRADFAADPQPFLNGKRSIFTEQGLRRAAEGWVRNVSETDELGKLLYPEHYFSLRYEDLLKQPWDEMVRLWTFLGAKLSLTPQTIPAGGPSPQELQKTLESEMAQNPDADWQKEKAREIAQPIQKGRQGSWREMFTTADREIVRQIADETLGAWGYEGT